MGEASRGRPPLRLRPAIRAISIAALFLCSSLTVLLTAPTVAAAPAPFRAAGRVSPMGPPRDEVRGTEPVTEYRHGGTPPIGICERIRLSGCPAALSAWTAGPALSASGPSSWRDLTPSPIPTSYPSGRIDPVMTYDSADAKVLLFGGEDNRPSLQRDTWEYAAGNWTQIIAGSSCSATTCPSARVGEALTFDSSINEAVLFGGYAPTFGGALALADTWTFAHGTWTNVTATAGTPPSPRWGMQMSYVSDEGYVLLFGGANLNGVSYEDTFTFDQGVWTNITPTETAKSLATPTPRDSGVLADSPSGYAMMFGGESNGTVVQDGSGCSPFIEFWFHAGLWAPANHGCVLGPRGANSSALVGVPCGRVYPGLAWSPHNQRFVLFGGLTSAAGGCATTFPYHGLNDTYLYVGTFGGPESYWLTDPSPHAPPDLYEMGVASDYRDGYAVIFGGALDNATFYGHTWRYDALVHASLGGPITMGWNASGFSNEFTLTAFGGSGSLFYSYSIVGTKNSHTLTDQNAFSHCADFYGGSGTVPSTGSVLTICRPDQTSFNDYRLSVAVTDLSNTSDVGYANWSFTVSPPEALQLFSEYQGVFFSNVSVNNTFGVYAQIGFAPVSSLYGEFEGNPLSFTHSNSSLYWWNATFDMGTVVDSWPGDLSVAAFGDGWNISTEQTIDIVHAPDWLTTLEHYGGPLTSLKASGTGPWNRSYTVTTTIALDIGKLFNFSIPIPFVGGNYSLIPSINLAIGESGSGVVTLNGKFTLTTPKISFGVGDLKLSVALNLTGHLYVVPQNGELTIQWDNATAQIAIVGDFSISIPVWGFKIDLGFVNGSVGFTVDIDIAPSVAINFFMLPSNSSSNDILKGVDLMVTEIFGQIALPIEVDASFGFLVGSISLGGKLSFEITLQISPGMLQPNNLWINGSILGKASFLCWSGTWNILGPANIYHWTPSFLAPFARIRGPSANATAGPVVWGLNPRAYNLAGYDGLVWSSAGTQGRAVSDIYPAAAPTAAAAYDGAYLFYSDDQVALPVAQGLTFSGLHLTSGTNGATPLAAPSDPGFLVTRPVASALPDGSIYVLWSALPTASATGNSPSGMTELALHGARYYPSNHTWGRVVDLTTSGFAESYAIDGSAGPPSAAALVSPQLVPSASTAEHLESFDLATGASTGAAAVSGLEGLLGVRSGPDVALVEDLNGNDSLANLTTGALRALPPVPSSAGSWPMGAQLLPGSPDVMLLRDRSTDQQSFTAVDLASGATWASMALPGDVRDVEGVCHGPSCVIYASNASGVFGWKVDASGIVGNASSVAIAGVGSFGIVQDGSGLLLFAMVHNGSVTSGLFDLSLAETGGTLPVITAGAPGGPGGGSSGSSTPPFDTLLYLGLPVLLAAAVLVLLAIRRRGSKGPASSPATDASPPGSTPPPGATG